MKADHAAFPAAGIPMSATCQSPATVRMKSGPGNTEGTPLVAAAISSATIAVESGSAWPKSGRPHDVSKGAVPSGLERAQANLQAHLAEKGEQHGRATALERIQRNIERYSEIAAEAAPTQTVATSIRIAA